MRPPQSTIIQIALKSNFTNPLMAATKNFYCCNTTRSCRRCTHQLIRPQTGSKRFRWVHRISQAGLISHWQLHVAEITPLNSHGHCMIMAPRLPLWGTSHPFNANSSHNSLFTYTQAFFFSFFFAWVIKFRTLCHHPKHWSTWLINHLIDNSFTALNLSSLTSVLP